MKERIGYYDIARGLGIIFVVIGHIDTFYVPFRSVVITFHMALFFMVSGMLFLETGEEENKYWEIVKKKFLRIMVPYFLFSLLSVGIEFIRLSLQGIYHVPHYKALFTSIISLYGNSVMWFLPALFISELVFLAVRKFRNDFVTILSVICLTVLAVWGNEQTIVGSEWMEEFAAAMIRGIYCTVFICIGYYVRKYMIPLKIPGYVYAVVSVMLLSICTVLKDRNPKVDLRTMKWGEIRFSTTSEAMLVIYPAILYLTGAVCGALGIIFLCRMLDKFSTGPVFKVLTFLGSNSLVIMATHLDLHVLHYSMELAELVNSLYPSSVVYHTALLIFVFAIEAVLIKCINRFVPVLAGKYKK